MQPRTGAWWDSLRIGIGPPPLRTEHGWLLLYHGVKSTVGGDIYRVGLALLDLDEHAAGARPRVVGRRAEPVLDRLDAGGGGVVAAAEQDRQGEQHREAAGGAAPRLALAVATAELEPDITHWSLTLRCRNGLPRCAPRAAFGLQRILQDDHRRRLVHDGAPLLSLLTPFPQD